LIDYVAIDLKHVRARYDDMVGIPQPLSFYDNFDKLKSFLLEDHISYEYRTTISKGFYNDHEIEEMARNIAGVQHYYLQNYRPGTTLDPLFAGKEFSAHEMKHMVSLITPYVQKA
jgi:pyruvate formate lyase activating enzyme